MTGTVYKRVRAKAYFLTPEEGGRDRDVDLRDPRVRYELLADLGLGFTEEGLPVRCGATLSLEGGGGGYVELGVEQTVRILIRCVEEAVVAPGVRFDLSQGAQVVARAEVLSVLETVYE